MRNNLERNIARTCILLSISISLNLLPGKAFAQDKHSEDHGAATKTAYDLDKVNTKTDVSEKKSLKFSDDMLRLSMDDLSTLDYASTEDLLKTVRETNGRDPYQNQYDFKKTQHNFSFNKRGGQLFTFIENMSFAAGNHKISNAKCVTVNDHFELLREDNIKWTFNNEYYLFFDGDNGDFIGSLKYIDYISSSGLKGEFKFTEVDNNYFTKHHITYNPQSKKKLNNLQSSNSLVILPNPAHTSVSFTIKLSSSSQSSLYLLDINGHEIRSIFEDKPLNEGTTKERIDVSDLPPGSYIVRLVTNTSIIHSKLTIQ